ncbi:MAG: DUF4256 domain-containing protein [Candidatus Eisenbacteria bacterium]
MNKLGAKQKMELLATLKARFEENEVRHEGISWEKVEAKLEASPTKLATLAEMEGTGGEPDVVGYDKRADEYLFFDCAKESPADRRSLCYDAEALASRKQHKPAGSAVAQAKAMGAELLSEEDYRLLQELGDFDTKTSSWLRTPEKIRSLGGAIFGDYRFDTVFVYHNGAESYYAGRGFRCLVRV